MLPFMLQFLTGRLGSRNDLRGMLECNHSKVVVIPKDPEKGKSELLLSIFF